MERCGEQIMGKGKPRQDSNKPQNKYGDWCQYAEEYDNGSIHCECGYGDAKVCKGNRHNCIKTKYHKLAARSDQQKIEDNKI
jgi:hypothetical protein